jgi:RNA polymerase sigma factor (sigma-70 family)
MMADADLVRAAQAGDAASLGLLLERYRVSLYRAAIHMLGDATEAQDAVHDAFLIALRKIDQVRDPAAAGGWLHMVVRNVCRTRLRSGHGEVLFEEFPQQVERRSSEPSIEEHIERVAMREWVWTALANLPETLRVTAMLRYFCSCSSYDEISAVLGVPVGTVCSRLSQVKIKLAEALLETAGLEHDEALQLVKSQTDHFNIALDEMSQGKGYNTFARGFRDDCLCTFSDGTVFHGREAMLQDLEKSLEAGMKMYPTNVLASRDITVLEASFENPPNDPSLCPPAVCQVHFQSGGETYRLHMYFALRRAECA